MSDADGRIVFSLDGVTADTNVLCLQVVALQTGSPGLEGTVQGARVVSEELNDFGVVLMEESEVLVQGLVVNEAGAGVSRASINIEALQSHGWFPLASGKSEADGTFSILGTLPHPSLRVVARAAAYQQSAPVEFLPGARNITLVLTDKGGSVSGSIILPALTASRDYSVRISSTSELDFTSSWTCLVAPDGTFAAANISSSLELSLEVQYSLAREPLIVVPGIHAAVEGAAQDPRLQKMELGDRLSLIEIALDANGLPCDGVVKAFFPDATRGKVFAAKQGQVKIPSGPQPLHVAAIVPGYLIVESDVMAPHARIELQEPSIQLSIGVINPQPSLAIELVHLSTGNEVHWWQPRSPRRGPRKDELVVDLQLGGIYRVQVRQRGEGDGGTVAVAGDVAIDAGRHQQRLEVDLAGSPKVRLTR